MKHTPGDEHRESLRRKHETTDADFRNLMVTGFGLLGIMVAGLLISWGLYVFMKAGTPEPNMNPLTFVRTEDRPALPLPRLQPSPSDSLKFVRKAEDSVLTGYGWVDADSGIARVPIARAKELLLEKGLPYQSGSAKPK